MNEQKSAMEQQKAVCEARLNEQKANLQKQREAVVKQS